VKNLHATKAYSLTSAANGITIVKIDPTRIAPAKTSFAPNLIDKNPPKIFRSKKTKFSINIVPAFKSIN
jgi:hypothetical protein